MSYARRGLVMAVLIATAGLVLLTGCSTRSGASPSTPPSRPAGAFTPSNDNKDPSKGIEGVVVTEYRPGHAHPGQRVAYDKFPPYGGTHDPTWADCTGTVYAKPVHNENMVHALEHGAVWIAYNPDKITGAALDTLAEKVDGQPYLMLSPYPGLDKPISLQSWGHQLKLDGADDERIDQFIQALRENRYTTPEPGAPCGTSPEKFDVADPPPFDPSPPGPDAFPLQGP